MVTSKAQVSVFFGTLPGTVMSLIKSDVDSTVLALTVPVGSTVGTVTVEVVSHGDTALAARFSYRYFAAPTPEVLSLYLLDGKPGANMNGGSQAGLTVVNLPHITSPGDVIVKVNGALAPVDKIISKTGVFAVTIPAGSLGPAVVQVYAAADGAAMSGFYTSLTYFDPNIPRLQSTSRSTGTRYGGDTLWIEFDGYEFKHDKGLYSIRFGDSAANVSVVERDFRSGVTSLQVSTPERLAGGAVSVTLVINGISAKNISFPFTYLAASLPAVLEVAPKTGSNVGGTFVRLLVEHIPVAQASIEALSVSFGGTPATIVSVDCDPQGRECGIVVRAPSYSGFGSVLASLIIPGTNSTSFGFSYYQPCEYKAYCITQSGQIPNQALIGTTTGLGPTCDAYFCQSKPTRSPRVSYLWPKTTPRSGQGNSIAVELGGFLPLQTASEIWLEVGGGSDCGSVLSKGLSGVTVTGVALQGVSVEDSTRLTFLAPELPDAGFFTVVATAMDETGVPLKACALIQYTPVPTGPPTVSNIEPSEGLLVGGDQITLEIANFPLFIEPGHVSVTFDSLQASVKQVYRASEQPEGRVNVVAPTRGAAGGGIATVTVSFINAQANVHWTATASYIYIELPPVELKSIFPISGLDTGGDTLRVVAGNLLETTTVGQLFLNFSTHATLVPVTAMTRQDDETVILTAAVPSLPASIDEKPATVKLEVTSSGGNRRIGSGSTVGLASFTYKSSLTPNIYNVDPPLLVLTQDTQVSLLVENIQQTGYPLLVTLCGQTIQTASSAWGATGLRVNFDFDYTLSNPVCIGQELLSLIRANAPVTTATLDLAAPPIQVTPHAVSLYGWEALEVTLFGMGGGTASSLTASHTGDTVALAVSNVAQTMVQEVPQAGFISFRLQAPPATTAGKRTVTIRNGDHGYTANFELEYLPPPLITSASPTVGGMRGGEEMTIKVTNFPAASAADVFVHFGSESTPVLKLTASASSRTATLTVRPPPATSAGVVNVTIANSKHASLGAASLSYTYETPEPYVAEMSASSGSLYGNESLTILVPYLAYGDGDKASQLTVSFGAQTKSYASIESVEIYGSGWEAESFVRVKTPAVSTPGELTITVETPLQSVSSRYTFVDTSMELLAAPVGGFRGISTGGSTVELTVRNFPTVEAAGDIVARFENAFGTVTGIAVGAETTKINVTAPAGASTAASSVTASLYPAAMPKRSLMFEYHYMSPLAGIKAQFTPSYAAVLITLNRDVSFAALGDTFPCSQVLSAASVGSLHKDECEVASPRSFRASVLHSATSTRPGDALTLKSNGLASADTLHSPVEPTVLSVADSETPMEPIAEADFPGEIGPCDEISLDGSASLGAGQLTYVWGCSNDAALNAYLARMPQQRLSLAGTRLTKPNFVYKMTLSVTDFTGRSSAVIAKDLRKSNLPVPQISIEGKGLRRHDDLGKDLVLKGAAEFSGCSGRQTIEFAWSQTAGPTLASTSDKSTLIVRASELHGGQTYAFQLVGWVHDDATLKGSARVSVRTPHCLDYCLIWTPNPRFYSPPLGEDPSPLHRGDNPRRQRRGQHRHDDGARRFRLSRPCQRGTPDLHVELQVRHDRSPLPQPHRRFASSRDLAIKCHRFRTPRDARTRYGGVQRQRGGLVEPSDEHESPSRDEAGGCASYRDCSGIAG